VCLWKKVGKAGKGKTAKKSAFFTVSTDFSTVKTGEGKEVFHIFLLRFSEKCVHVSGCAGPFGEKI
jgi:hypothetical protein